MVKKMLDCCITPVDYKGGFLVEGDIELMLQARVVREPTQREIIDAMQKSLRSSVRFEAYKICEFVEALGIENILEQPAQNVQRAFQKYLGDLTLFPDENKKYVNCSAYFVKIADDGGFEYEISDLTMYVRFPIINGVMQKTSLEYLDVVSPRGFDEQFCVIRDLLPTVGDLVSRFPKISPTTHAFERAYGIMARAAIDDVKRDSIIQGMLQHLQTKTQDFHYGFGFGHA